MLTQRLPTIVRLRSVASIARPGGTRLLCQLKQGYCAIMCVEPMLGSVLPQSMIVVEELRKAQNGGYTLGPNYSNQTGKTHEISTEDKIPGRTVRNLMRSHGVRREGVRCNLLTPSDGDMFAFNDRAHPTLSSNRDVCTPHSAYCGVSACVLGVSAPRDAPVHNWNVPVQNVAVQDRAKTGTAEGAQAAQAASWLLWLLRYARPLTALRAGARQ